MGFRYRKSIKIAPGVKLNLGKKSASVSFGVKGARQTISTTGRKTTTVGIPGSGLYYTKSSSSKNTKANKNNSYVPNNTYSNEDAYQAVEDFNDSIDYLTTLHKNYDYDYNWEAIYNEPPPFKFGEKGPNELHSIGVLEKYKPNILEKIFISKLEKKIKKLENDISISKDKDDSLYIEWKKQNELAKLVLEGDLNSYIKALQDLNFSNNLQGMINSFNFKISKDDVLTIDYHINIDGIIPEQYASLTQTGKLSIKNYTKTAYYEILKLYVCGLALHISRNAFGLLPIKTVIVNTNNYILNTEIGRQEDISILSTMINRDELEKLNFDLIDPYDSLNNFKHNVKFLKTKGFQPVEKIII
ncbi:DUF4236 domain-containing protein [Tissierella creatinophila]|uniref:DUF4236 domain-containing protein n=1 Tax=Tissierella creatinophila DSM 6911 TaxID=1123403 RepID=A0A1U7M5K3_TISCR|nr:DUF4236 domain-containing protein [Tissierella creatinophila]OLS02604.1 hypothetical protein TICRE_14050 [Tissierella creatinophila DSM 6911]